MIPLDVSEVRVLLYVDMKYDVVRSFVRVHGAQSDCSNTQVVLGRLSVPISSYYMRCTHPVVVVVYSLSGHLLLARGSHLLCSIHGTTQPQRFYYPPYSRTITAFLNHRTIIGPIRKVVKRDGTGLGVQK